jgi:hypothetical protein
MNFEAFFRLLAVYGAVLYCSVTAAVLLVVWFLLRLIKSPHRLDQNDREIMFTAGGAFALGFGLCYVMTYRVIPFSPSTEYVTIGAMLYGIVYLVVVWASRTNKSVQGAFSPRLWATFFTPLCGLVLYAHAEDDFHVKPEILLFILLGCVFAIARFSRGGTHAQTEPPAYPATKPLRDLSAAATPSQVLTEDDTMSSTELPPEPTHTEAPEQVEVAPLPPQLEPAAAAPNMPALVPQRPPPVPAIPRAVATRTMQLKLRRAQRSGLTGKVIFVLDARMEVPAEERQLIERYRLGSLVIYDSADRQKYAEAKQAHLESTREAPGFREGAGSQLLGAGKTFYRLARAGVSAAIEALSLRVTVANIIQGVHVECKSMDELLGAEKAIIEAAENLRTYIDTAETFDGRETVLEF